MKQGTIRSAERTWSACLLFALLILLLPSAFTPLQAQVRIPSGMRPSDGRGGFNGGLPTTSNTGTNRPNPGESTVQADTSATKGLIFAKETPDSVLIALVFR